MSLMWVVPIYILNVACSVYILAVYWNLEDPVTICVIVDCAHYIVIFILLIGVWLKWPDRNANRPLSWLEVFPTFGYVGSIFVIALQEQTLETIISISNFSVAIFRFAVLAFAASRKKQFRVITEYDIAY